MTEKELFIHPIIYNSGLSRALGWSFYHPRMVDGFDERKNLNYRMDERDEE